MQIMKGTLTMY